jgi:hypothetical protein
MLSSHGSTFGLPVYPTSFTLVQISVVRCCCLFQDMNMHCCWYCWNHTWNFFDIQYPTLHIQRSASRQVTWNECISFLKARCALVISVHEGSQDLNILLPWDQWILLYKLELCIAAHYQWWSTILFFLMFSYGWFSIIHRYVCQCQI